MELELVDTVFGVEQPEARDELPGERRTVARIECSLHFRLARNQCTQCLGDTRFGSDAVRDRLEMSIQFLLLGRVDQLLHDAQIGHGQQGANEENRQTHGQHGLGPQPQLSKHVLRPPLSSP
jgi:hypothetical protein